MFFALFANFVSAEVEKTINNLVAGKLSSVLTVAEKATVNRLTVQGTVNAEDFFCMRNEMPMLTDVDLSGTSIEASGSNAAGVIPPYALSRVYSANQNLQSFQCPRPMVAIGEYAFSYCTSLTNIALDSCTSSIGKGSFVGCTALTSIYLPDRLDIINELAFGGCTALSGRLTIPNAVRTIADRAFEHCTKLTELVVGSSVDSIGKESFNFCSSLSFIRFLGEGEVRLSTGTFAEIAQGSIIYVRKGNLKGLVKRDSWPNYTTLMEYRTRISSISAAPQSATVIKLLANIDFLAEDDPNQSYGFCLSMMSAPTVDDTLFDHGNSPSLGNYSNLFTDFYPGGQYFIRPYLIDRYGVIYGAEMKVKGPVLPGPAYEINGPTEVSEGQSNVVFSVLPIGDATSYVWTLPTGVTGSSTKDYIMVSFAKGIFSGTIKVCGRNEHGDGLPAFISFIAHPLPKDGGKITGYSSVCQGESQVAYSIPVVEGATSYVWTLPSGATGISKTNSIVVNYSKTAISGMVTVAGKNNYGLGAASSLAVMVHQLPVIELRDTIVTYATALPLNPVVKYKDGGILKYKWTPSTNLSSDTLLNPVATTKSPITYTLTVTTPYGCTTSKSMVINIKAMDKPVIGIVSIVNSKNRIAWNKPVSQGVASYHIYKEANVSDVYEKIGTVPYDSMSVFEDANSVPDVKSSKYKISVLDKVGIESLQSDPHKTMHLSINRGHNNNWNLIWEPYEGFKPSTYNIYRGTSPISLNFLDATSGSSTQYSDLDAPTGNVYYQVEVISPNLVNPTKVAGMLRAASSIMATYNSSRSNLVVGIVNSLSETTRSIRIYPNPVKDVLNIEMEGGSSFDILNLTGQVVFRGDIKESTVVNTCTYKPGMYLVKISVGSGFEYRKIIKE